MVSYSTQNYSSLKKSTLVHILSVGQTWSNLVKLSQTLSNSLKKTCIIWYGSLQVHKGTQPSNWASVRAITKGKEILSVEEWLNPLSRDLL